MVALPPGRRPVVATPTLRRAVNSDADARSPGAVLRGRRGIFANSGHRERGMRRATAAQRRGHARVGRLARVESTRRVGMRGFLEPWPLGRATSRFAAAIRAGNAPRRYLPARAARYPYSSSSSDTDPSRPGGSNAALPRAARFTNRSVPRNAFCAICQREILISCPHRTAKATSASPTSASEIFA